MSTPLPQPSPLPDWMIIFAFVASLILAILKIFEGIFRAIRKTRLEIVLTRDVFFRILETGEALYLNAVLIAYDAGALIKEIKASLKKEDGATKEFSLKVAQIGEKYRSSEGLYQFSFYSSSPLSFIPENNPQRQIYICEHDAYAEATRQAFQRFQQALLKLKEEYNDITSADETQKAAFLFKVDAIKNEAYTSIMDKIQIEPGKYTLHLTVTYKQKSMYVPGFITKTANSTIQFVVEGFARDFIRTALNEYLQNKAFQVLTNQTNTIQAPEYLPSNVVELSAK